MGNFSMYKCDACGKLFDPMFEKNCSNKGMVLCGQCNWQEQREEYEDE